MFIVHGAMEHGASSKSVYCLLHRVTWRWVTLAHTSVVLTASRQLFWRLPSTWATKAVSRETQTQLCVGNKVSSTTCSLFRILCREPFNLGPWRRSAGRWKMGNCRQGAATTFSNVHSREKVFMFTWVCVCVRVVLHTVQITFDFSTMASVRQRFASLLYISLSICWFSCTHRNVCVAGCQWHKKFSLFPTPAQCFSLVLSFLKREPKANENNLIFLWDIFSDVVFLHFVPPTPCKDWTARCVCVCVYAHSLCSYIYDIQTERRCMPLCAWWTLNSERHTSFVFSLYFAYVPLQHFNCVFKCRRVSKATNTEQVWERQGLNERKTKWRLRALTLHHNFQQSRQFVGLLNKL